MQVDEDVIALLSAIKLFDEQCNENSEQCKFWNNFRYIVGVIKNLVLADREGDFLLSVKSIQDLCPIFLGADAIHYLRYGSFYLKTFKSLKYDHHKLYAAFMKGDFVIKTSKRPFNGVTVDMKLDQTIQRSAKSVGGIIGRSKAVHYVTEWSIIYHDVLGITNWFRELTGADTGGNTETRLHHEMKKSKIDEVNTSVSMLAEFIRIRGNPFQCQQGDEKLKNFVTQIEAENEVAKAHCSFLGDTQEEYADFRKATYVDKSRLLSDKITKFSLKPIDYIDTQANDQESTKVHVAKKSEKLSRLAMKILMIAKDKADELEYVLQHDITSYNYLFDGSTMTKTNKSHLISLLKAYLIQEDYKFEQVSHNVSVFVDFMSYLRSQLVSNLPGATFGTVLTYILSALIRKHSSKTKQISP